MAVETTIDDIHANLKLLIQGTVSKDKTTPSLSGIAKDVHPLDGFLNNPAPNIIEWANRPEFLNFIIEDEHTNELKSIFNHFGQYQSLRDFLELLCPICASKEDYDCWGKSRESLETQPLLVWNKSYKDDECPRCKTTRAELREANLLKVYDTMLLLIGMRGAKSVTSAILASWIEHKILTYQNPQKFFVQAPNQPLEVSFVATTHKQSMKTVFESWKGLRENSPWLQNYIKKLKSYETFKGQNYEENSNTIKYNHINILFESLNSNSSGVAGATRLASFIDELARFDTTESKRSAKEVYRVFNQGLRTIRSVKIKYPTIPNCFGTMVVTTSPISVNDYAMKLGEKSNKLTNMYFVHKATWEFNPFEPQENFVEDFKLDPIGAERDFGAKPPLAESPLVTDPEAFENAIDSNLRPVVSFVDIYPKDPTGREYIGKAVQFCQIDHKSRKVLIGDAGKDKDSFSLTMAHGEYIIKDNRPVWVTVYDFVLTVRPTVIPKRIVEFDCVERIIEKIAEKQKIDLIRFDRWNSESIIQSLRFKGRNADNFSVKTDHYSSFIQDCYQGKVKMLPPANDDAGRDPYIDMSDAGRAIHEIKHLERSPDFKKVDHRVGEHNDLAVGVVGCHYLVQNMISKTTGPGVSYDLPADAAPQSPGVIGQFRRW